MKKVALLLILATGLQAKPHPKLKRIVRRAEYSVLAVAVTVVWIYAAQR